MNMKLLVFYILFTGSLNADAKLPKVPQHHRNTKQLALLQPDISAIPDGLADRELVTNTKLLAIQPPNKNADEGRFFKHIFLFRNLMQPPSNQPGYMLPYIIINNPTNLTNVNNNSLSNVPATAAPATGAGTGAGTGTGGTGTGTRFRFRLGNQILPYDLPIPLGTPVYQQRQQQDLPQFIYGFPLQEVNTKQHQRKRFGTATKKRSKNAKQNNNNNNPFRKLANNFPDIQLH